MSEREVLADFRVKGARLVLEGDHVRVSPTEPGLYHEPTVKLMRAVRPPDNPGVPVVMSAHDFACLARAFLASHDGY